MAVSNVKKLNKKKTSMPALIAAIVSIVIILAFVASLLATNGVFVRMQKGAKSDNFDINGSMMSYFTYSYYQNWLNEYYYYIYLGYVDFDPNAPLDEQYVDEEKTQTYFDFFSKAAASQASTVLKYCEAAMADSAVNFDEMKKTAEADAKATIEDLLEDALEQGYTESAYIRMTFGESAKKNDVIKAMTLQNVASEYYNIVYDRFYDAVTEADKEGYFAEHLEDFVSAEYLTYAITSSVAVPTVKPEDYEGGEDSEEYKAALAEAKAAVKAKNDELKVNDKAIIDAMAAAESTEAFKKLVMEHAYDSVFTEAYNALVKDFSDAQKPSKEELEAFEAEIKDAVITATLEGKTDIIEPKETEESEEAEEASAWATVKEELPADIIELLNSKIKSATKSATYSLKDDLNKWLFGGVKAQFGIEYAEGEDAEGTSAKVGESKTEEKISDEELGNYTLTVNYVSKAAARDEDHLRNVGHILLGVGDYGDYATIEDAKAKADDVYAELLTKADANGLVSKENFEAIGKEYTNDSSVFYDNVAKGDMVEAFEAWLYEQTEVGKMGFVETEYGVHVMYYAGESDFTAWGYTAHEGVTGEQITEWFEELPYEVTVNEKIFSSILK